MAPKVVLITGCSSGIGLTTAVLLAKESKTKCCAAKAILPARDTKPEFKVYATMRNLKSKGDLEKAAGDTLNKTLFIRELDVTKENTIKTVVDEILRDNGRIDVLLNNAGYSGEDAVDTRSMEWCHAMMDTNYWGVVRTVRAVLPAMKKQKSGSIINVTSISGIVGSAFYSTYASSKFAVEGFTEAMAGLLLEGYNIRVSIVEPGPVQTPLIAKLAATAANPEVQIKDYDDTLKKLHADYSKFAAGVMGSLMQTPDEVAKLFLEIIRSEKPHLRYQTSPGVNGFVTAMKLKEGTTDGLLAGLQGASGV